MNPTSIYKCINIEQNWVFPKIHPNYLLVTKEVPASFESNSKLFKFSTKYHKEFLKNIFKDFKVQKMKFWIIFNV